MTFLSVPCKKREKMKESLPKSIFELIDTERFRKRPLLYIGKNSISSLRIFMDGYKTCELFNEIKYKDTNPPFWLFFPWICKYYNHSGSYFSWDGIILQNCENDEAKALKIFFERLDEFRQLKPKRIICCQINEKDIEFFYSHEGIRRLIKDGKEERIGPADNIFIIEYEKDFGCSSHHLKEENGINSDFFKSIDIGIKDAEREYGKSIIWKEIPTGKLSKIYEKVIKK